MILFLIILFFFIFFYLIYLIYCNKLYKKEFFKINDIYTAIIIEPRKHQALYFVLENFVGNLPQNWNFIIFHGNKNIDYVYSILNQSILLRTHKHRITLYNLHVDNLTIDEYNHLLVSKKFYDYIPTEIFLLFQTDSMICKNYHQLLNNFIEYDYTGAPWRDKTVGNGGLSLRRKSKMLAIIENCTYNNEAEDLYFTKACPHIARNLPSFEDAKKFSVETVYHDISFGVHKPWNYIKEDSFRQKVSFCEGLDQLKILNKQK